MSRSDIRRRLAALERPAAVVTRLFVAIDPPEGAEFFGVWATPIWNTDYRIENLDPDEFFLVHGTDREACIERAHQMANGRWTEHPLLVVVIRPITEPPTEVHQ